MEYGAIDLHLRRSQIRIIDEHGAVVLDRRMDTTRAELDAGVWRARADADADGEQHRERVGGAASRGAGARGGGGRSELRGDVWRAVAEGEDGRAGCGGAGDGESARGLSARPIGCRPARGAAAAAARAAAAGAAADGADQSAAGVAAAGRAATALGTRRARAARLRAGRRCRRRSARSLAPRADDAGGDLTTARGGRRPRSTRAAAADAVTQRLMTAPGVGPILALTFQAVLDDARSGLVGMRPGQCLCRAGAARRQFGGAAAQRPHHQEPGPGDLRALLVQASWTIWRSRAVTPAPLRAGRSAGGAPGRRMAMVALARRLTRILYAMWRDGTEFAVRAARDARRRDAARDWEGGRAESRGVSADCRRGRT